MQTLRPVRQALAGYDRTETRPLGAYAGLIGLFNGLAALFVLIARRGALPERVALGDLLLVGVATQRLSRLIAKDAVTSVLRAPFTTFERMQGESEVSERPRGTSWRLALGELLTCPFCLAQWVAAGFTYGMALAPRTTRLFASMFAAVTLADTLQFLYDMLKQRAEKG